MTLKLDIPERDETLGWLGENLRRRRASSGLTQKELADRRFLPQDRLPHLERANLTPSVLIHVMRSYWLRAVPAALLGVPAREASRALLRELIEGNPGSRRTIPGDARRTVLVRGPDCALNAHAG